MVIERNNTASVILDVIEYPRRGLQVIYNTEDGTIAVKDADGNTIVAATEYGEFTDVGLTALFASFAEAQDWFERYVVFTGTTLERSTSVEVLINGYPYRKDELTILRDDHPHVTADKYSVRHNPTGEILIANEDHNNTFLDSSTDLAGSLDEVSEWFSNYVYTNHPTLSFEQITSANGDPDRAYNSGTGEIVDIVNVGTVDARYSILGDTVELKAGRSHRKYNLDTTSLKHIAPVTGPNTTIEIQVYKYR